jgi:hypothetical protein
VVGGAESLLLILFAVTVENGFLQMLPLPGNIGEALRRWNRGLWLAGLSAMLFVFFHLLMNPSGSLAEALRNGNVRFFILTVVVFCLGVGALWLYFRLARARSAPAASPAAAGPAVARVDVSPAKVGEPGVVLLDEEPVAMAASAGPKSEPRAAAKEPLWEISARGRPKKWRISPLGFGVLGLAVALALALIFGVCLVVALIVTFG